MSWLLVGVLWRANWSIGYMLVSGMVEFFAAFPLSLFVEEFFACLSHSLFLLVPQVVLFVGLGENLS